ncbi:uncharacterized protein RBU33_016663 [Hipposideros larvatus]
MVFEVDLETTSSQLRSDRVHVSILQFYETTTPTQEISYIITMYLTPFTLFYLPHLLSAGDRRSRSMTSSTRQRRGHRPSFSAAQEYTLTPREIQALGAHSRGPSAQRPRGEGWSARGIWEPRGLVALPFLAQPPGATPAEEARPEARSCRGLEALSSSAQRAPSAN